ncbi:MAG: type III pantothenate kinase [Salinivirgaceae bacterium]|nr:type III pantothenate kinase [Salinivirgaceae bacterium]
MNLVLDIGNTQFKICVFNKQKIEFHSFFKELSKDTISSLIKEYAITKAIYSDTRGLKQEKINELFSSNIPLIELCHTTPIPIKLNYTTPETLGKDRIAGAVASYELFKGLPILVIDIGTAITIDFINEFGVFEGGIISPGPELRYKALHQFTGKLPLLECVEKTDIIGKSTKTAIESGVQNGILFEVNEYILTFYKQYNKLKIVLTGGYAYLFDKKIKYPIFADSFLIPKGLNRILNYNDKKTKIL